VGGGAGQAGGGGSGGFEACAMGVAAATKKVLPVDIIWVVDNSKSMQPAVTQVNQGINDFAGAIGTKGLDYKVIMLALRGKTVTQIGGKDRYPICVPSPLAGDDNCGNGPHFFQAEVDIKSTQPLEQFLGTLGQTTGYTVNDGPGTPSGKGGPPWKDQLRPEATKTIVIVSDDNSRLVASDFLHFAGGKNPFNSYKLPPGILDPSWTGLFDQWVVDALYGWGSESDPAVTCTYPDKTTPPAPGTTYTDLVKMSSGVRAQICAGAPAWKPFFDGIAQSVVATSKLECTIDIPPAPSGVQTINPNKVNVSVKTASTETILPRVDGPGGAKPCDPVKGGWYYDDAMKPTKINLCKASCDAANAQVGVDKSGEIDVTFGCDSYKP
jgi:hypothetical protein